jgi:allophanate hydrolase subunit 1
MVGGGQCNLSSSPGDWQALGGCSALWWAEANATDDTDLSMRATQVLQCPELGGGQIDHAPFT